ncbi:anthranilate phosphoribosyltransferase [Beggiatoa alba B18LD]|uniref:Anthranilate phosphoribosyltransferase n=1 Tax=Beggiatoa alba B18LD TaxID=395493 RepID=I3CDB5_9GAMM|nr:anthranilate phosphoribosyltransferase [Beggiatoa alba]EIJ41608.1 anthranilate phosphoribosyltransferase [Beggiatoa alba B18LD]
MDIKTALKAIIEKQDLSREEMLSVMTEIMTGQATPAQIGGFLIGLRMKGETVEEITAATQVMRDLAIPVKVDVPNLVDIVGTGGDGQSTFNISTTSAFVVAAAGAHVAKHGNRSVSSRSGSADILEALGVKLDLTPEQIADCVEKIGVGFMFAPQHHTAMKHAIVPRREMAVRTIFNLLGPMTNPAKAPNQLLGVYSRDWLEPVAEVLKRLGSRHVLVVHSADGLDEISVAAPTYVAELKDGNIRSYTIEPELFGIQTAPLSTIQVNSVAESLTLVNRVLDNQTSPARDVVLLNAGATLYVSGMASDIMQGIAKAREVLANGSAKQKLAMLIQHSNHFKQPA